GDAVGNGEVHGLGAVIEALAVLGELENLTAVGPLSLEHRAGVVQAMAQHVQIGLAPGHELAVVPDEAIAVVIGDQVGHGVCLLVELWVGRRLGRPAGYRQVAAAGRQTAQFAGWKSTANASPPASGARKM